jgi:hypothetical protein
MSKPFTTIAALLFLIVAAVHGYRLYSGAIAISVAGHDVPLWASWAGGAVALVLAIMLFVEARR